MAHPNTYKTLAGLLKAVERVLRENRSRINGQSRGMWLHNAEWNARERFKRGEAVRELRARYSTSRAQDLTGGHGLFGFPLPTRSYQIGDNVPGVGTIADEVSTQLGRQFQIDGQWYLESVIDPNSGATANAA